jgi:hypothetical protein
VHTNLLRDVVARGLAKLPHADGIVNSPREHGGSISGEASGENRRLLVVVHWHLRKQTRVRNEKWMRYSNKASKEIKSNPTYRPGPRLVYFRGSQISNVKPRYLPCALGVAMIWPLCSCTSQQRIPESQFPETKMFAVGLHVRVLTPSLPA